MARFQSFWLGKSLPPCAVLCMKSFIDHGHDYDLYSYDPISVPDGLRVLDANEILPRSEVFFYQEGEGKGSVAAFANVFRYKLLTMLGGWWVDTDVLCLSPQVPEGEIFMERESEDLICNAVIKFPKGHEFVKALYDKSREAGKNLSWGQTGPRLITEMARKADLFNRTGLQSQAFPIHWKQAFLPVTARDSATTYERTGSTSFLHLWNEIFRREGSLALHHPPDGSFLADVYEKHSVQRGSGGLLVPYKLRKLRVEVRSLKLRLKTHLVRLANRTGYSKSKSDSIEVDP